METVARNAKQSLARHKVTRAGDLTTRSQALQQLQDALELDEAPAAHRVLRHQPRAGHPGRRLDGRLRGRPAAQVRVPPVHRARRRDRRHRRHRRDARGAHPPVPPRPARGGRRGAAGCRGRGADGRLTRGRGPARPVRLPPQPRRRRRRAAPGQRRRPGPGGLRGRRRRGGRAGQAARGGLGAGGGVPGGAAPHQRGPLPAAAAARRGAPLRDHLPPAAPVEGDDHQPARRHPGPGGEAAQGAAQAVRVGQADPGGLGRRARRRARA